MKIFKPTFYIEKLYVSKLKYIKSTSLISQQHVMLLFFLFDSNSVSTSITYLCLVAW